MIRRPIFGTPTNVATWLSSRLVALSDQRGDPANGTTHETPASSSAFTGTGAYGTGVPMLYELRTPELTGKASA